MSGRRIYIAHPYAADPALAYRVVARLAHLIAQDGDIPVAPHLFLPALYSESDGRDAAMMFCEMAVSNCDELRLYGATLSEDMAREATAARLAGVPVRDFTESGETSASQNTPPAA